MSSLNARANDEVNPLGDLLSLPDIDRPNPPVGLHAQQQLLQRVQVVPPGLRKVVQRRLDLLSGVRSVELYRWKHLVVVKNFSSAL